METDLGRLSPALPLPGIIVFKMTRPESHRIDERAQRVFRSKLPDSWVPREQHPDYRIDYTIEIFDGDKATGLFWHAQLKGVKAPRFLKSDAAISFSLDVEHMEYYLDKVALPVFLIVVDTIQEEGWWVFLQHYARTNLRSDWRTKSTVTIRLPMANSIEDSATLQAAVLDATKYMRELHPSSISASVIAEKDRLETIDPRFEVGINATHNGIDYSLTPKAQDVHFTLRFRGEEAIAKARELVEAGGKVHFRDGEAEISGMAAEWRDDYELFAIETTREVPAMIRFVAAESTGNAQAALDLHGTFARGSKRGRFNCELAGGLMTVCLPVDSEKTQVPIDISFDFSKWLGCDVRLLPHLDAIIPFFEAVSREAYTNGKDLIEVEVFVLGNLAMRSAGDIPLAQQMQSYSRGVLALGKAREVAKELDIEAIVSADMAARHISEIEVVFGLLKYGVHSFPARDACLRGVMKKADFAEQRSDLSTKGSEMSTFQGGGFPFLSTVVDIGFQKVAFSAMTIDESQSKEVDSSSVELVFVADQNCLCTLTQCTEAETEMLKDLRPQGRREK